MNKIQFRAVVVMIIASLICIGFTYAADESAVAPVAKHYLILKTKAGVCRLCQSVKDKTPASIAGPFATKEEAQAGKAKLVADGTCPPSGKKQAAADK